MYSHDATVRAAVQAFQMTWHAHAADCLDQVYTALRNRTQELLDEGLSVGVLLRGTAQ